eukprot:6143405-Amphidinium_carterae.2
MAFRQWPGSFVHQDQVSPPAPLSSEMTEHNFCDNQMQMHFADASLNSSSLLGRDLHRREELIEHSERPGPADGPPSCNRRMKRRQRNQLTPLRFATINVRSLLCDDSP